MIPTFLRNSKLGSKLMLLLLTVILAPLTLLGFLFYQNSAQWVQEKSDKESLQVLNLVMRNADEMLRGVESQLLDIYNRDDIIEQLSETPPTTGGNAESRLSEDGINRYLRNFLRGKDDVDSVYFLSEEGTTSFADFRGSSLFTDQIVRNPQWLERIAEENGRVVWIPTYEIPPNRYSAHNSYYFAAGMSIRDVTDELQALGTLILNVKISALDRLVGPVDVSPHGTILVADDSGNLIWHPDSEAYGTRMSGVSFYKATKPGEFVRFKLNGENYRIGRILSDFNNWSYYAIVPQIDLDAQTENQKRFLIVTIVAFSALFLLLAWLTTRYITKPIRQMVVAMKQIQKDPQGMQLQANSNDEIGMLQTAFNGMRGRIADLIQEVRIVSDKEKEAEIRALQAQINPHFVYNTLDAINWLAIEKDENEISSMITALSDMMRYAIRPGAPWVRVEEELRWARAYAYLQEMRFEAKFAVEFAVPTELARYRVPRLLLQPYLENAILHGMENLESGGLIRVSLNKESEDRLRLVVEDNGSGISADRMEDIKTRKSHGIGITNMDDRLKLEYDAGYGVTVESEPERGTRVTVVLPVIEEENEP
ncbi:cache domain-containing sensor histidine kinase [Cohnella herbarum]|uniref:histidine kinase n=1 Tax=Cohnella herbarum TaxID=2728023 RepID=A0A7Z2ZLT7_9BACL|nr:sensor histidine kinase [Cohnella herbarum]QJD84244.1 sensor histidine kinase [Cohnella herbarum]